MIPVETWQITGLIILALGCTLAAFVVGRDDRRRLSQLRAVWRAEVREELRARHETEVDLAERRGAARARETCGCAGADRQIREARDEITELRDQLDIANRRNRRAQDLAGRGGLILARDLSRVLAGQPLGDRTDSTPEAVA